MALSVHARIQKLRQFPPGRAKVAARDVAAAARALGHLALGPFVDAVHDAARAYVHLRAQRFGQIEARGGGRAGPIDKQCDVRVGFMHDTARRYVDEMPGSPEAAAAERLLRRYFPRGLRAFVQAPYEEELIQLEVLVDGLSGADADLARALTIGHHLDALRGLVPQYTDALKYVDAVTPGELAAAWQAVHAAVFELCCAVLAFARDAAHRDQLLAPIFDQDDRLAAIYARRRSGQAVEEIDLDDEVADIIDALAEGNGDGFEGDGFEAASAEGAEPLDDAASEAADPARSPARPALPAADD